MLHQNSSQCNTPTDAPSIKVTRLQPKSKCAGTFKALADVEVGGLWAIYGLQIVQSRRSGVEVFWPTSHDYSYAVQPLSLTVKRAVEGAVLAAWQGVGGGQ